MIRQWTFRLAVTAIASVCASTFAASVAAAQTPEATGIIRGHVVGSAGREPVAGAAVSVDGTGRGAIVAADGSYQIAGVRAGTVQVRARRIGYQPLSQPATVTAGAVTTIDFALVVAATQLDAVLTTVTGPQRRVEQGTNTAQIDAASVVKTSPVSNIQDVLASRTPGVTVTGGSQAGAGSRVRIRGNSSLNLSNDPIYVIDGVRLTSTSGSPLFTGGAQPNRANDINPDDIETIEIVKGPSAATLYGTDAANGVIVITTKRGRAGRTEWNAFGEGGLIQDHSSYDYNYTLAGHSPSAPGTPLILGECTLSKVASGVCVADSVRKYSPLHDASATPIGTGYRNKGGLSARGGTDLVRYFVSGEREEEVGVQELPEFERHRFDSAGMSIPDYVNRPNGQYKYSFRANVNANATPKLDFAVSSFFTHSNTHYATESNATAGIGSQIFGGRGYRENGTVSGLGTPLYGYRAWTPGYTYQEQNAQLVNRTILSGNANWKPLSWLQNRGNVGLDYAEQYSGNLLRRGDGPPVNSTYRLGFKDDYRTSIRNFSVDLASTAIWNASEAAVFRTTVGTQYINFALDQAEAFGQQLSPGATTTNSGSIKSANERTDLSKTLGVFVEEQLSLRDRLFITGAVRTDQNSAFGTNFQRVYYPKLQGSYVISDENYFPNPSWLDQLRLRAAYGASGVQPGPNDALRFFNGVSTNYKGTDSPAIYYQALGNSALKPERTAEFEGGLDATLFGKRSNLELTYYSKTTHDALIDAIVAPSAGAANSVKRNIGSVKNAGFEALLTTKVVDRPGIGFDFAVTGAINDNKLVSLGDVPAQIGTTTRAQAGYPLFGFWARPITSYQDKNGDGIFTYNADPSKNEVFVGDSSIFRGYSSPRWTATVAPGFELFGRRLRIASLFDYKGGFLHYNNTERIRCVSRQNCNGLMNTSASPEEQAMVVATLENPAKTLDGFFQKGDFVRWRELSATYTLPERLSSRVLRTRSASLNFAARNLHLWTAYRGLDPEIDRQAGETSTSGANGPGDEFQTLGIPTYFTLRLNLGF